MSHLTLFPYQSFKQTATIPGRNLLITKHSYKSSKQTVSKFGALCQL